MAERNVNRQKDEQGDHDDPDYSRKTHFGPYIYIFQRAVTQSKIVRLARFFSTGSEHSNEVFVFL